MCTCILKYRVLFSLTIEITYLSSEVNLILEALNFLFLGTLVIKKTLTISGFFPGFSSEAQAGFSRTTDIEKGHSYYCAAADCIVGERKVSHVKGFVMHLV